MDIPQYLYKGVMEIYDNPGFLIVVTKKNKERIYYETGKIQTNNDQVKSGVIDIFIKSIEHTRKLMSNNL